MIHTSGPLSRLVLVAVLIAGVASGPPVAAAQEEDPTLAQTIAPGLPVADGPVELANGHVDVGPRFVDGTWSLLVHDATTTSAVWRRPDDVVFRLGDGGRVPVPDDPQYRFVGVESGRPVWVVPQTENPAVVWLGWNTQDPEVMERIDRGVQLRLIGADGPGRVSVYLQAGTLAGPDVLWRSGDGPSAPLWVDVNSHTHANWVFTEPGAYVLRVEATADLVDGTRVSDVADLRVAVGDAVPAAEVRSAGYDGPDAPGVGGPGGDAIGADQASSDGATPAPTALAVLAVVVAILIAGVVARGAVARRRVAREQTRG
jgi:surface-anchored protein